jgi:hypothetical protein
MAAAKNVKMQMGNGLTAVVARIDYDTIAA